MEGLHADINKNCESNTFANFKLNSLSETFLHISV